MASPLRRVREFLAGLELRRQVARLLPGSIRQSYLAKFLVALALIIVLSGAVSTALLVGISDRLDRQVDTEVRATTQLHETIYTNWFATREQRLNSIAQQRFFAGGSLNQASQQLSLVQARSDIYTHLHLLRLNSGRVLASSSEEAVGRNYYDHSANGTIIRDGTQFVHPRQYRTFDGQRTVGLIVRLNSANRVLVAEVKPSNGPDPPQTRQGSTTAVVNRDGEALFGPSNVSGLPPGVSGSVEVTRTNGNLLSFRRLANTQLVIVRDTPVQQAFGVKRAVLVTFIVTLFLNTGILVIIGLIGGRAATDDLKELVKKANTMARGDLQVNLSTNRRDEIGQLYGAFGDMRDAIRKRIEESEAAKADAEEAKAAIQEQSAIISVLNRVLRHNLRNDLVVINGHVDELERHVDAEGDDHLETIQTRTNDLLDKAEKARQIEQLVDEDRRLERIDAVKILRREVEQFEREYPDASIEVDLPSSASVRAHDALGFVFSNIVENAIEHNDAPEPVVEVTASKGNGWVVVQIGDNGPGIPRTEIESIEAGYETAIRHSEGIGLWLVNWLVNAMQGELSFERRESGGTVVTIKLKQTTEPPAVQQSPASE